jgi:hypothetical protein
MAFNMKRPIIKGTKLHKASVAKAKDSIVPQTRTKADSSLVEAYSALGQSKIPHAIDYTFDMPEIKILKGKKKKKPDSPKIEIEETYDARGKYEMDPNQLKDRPLVVDPISTGDPEIKAGGEFLATGKDWMYKGEKPKEKKFDRSKIITREEAGRGTGKSGKLEKDVYAAKVKAAQQYAIPSAEDMVSDGKGGYVPREGAKSIEGDTWDSQYGGWRDDAPEQYYGPEGQKISKETADSITTQLRKIQEKKSLKQKLKEFKENNPGKRATQTNLDKYEQEKIEEEQLHAELSNLEQDDPEWWEVEQQEKLKEKELEQISFKPQVLPDETITTPVEPKRKDYKTSSDYMRARMKYYKQLEKDSPTEMRDNRIWRNAIKRGKVQQNMLKMGYIPPNYKK